MSSGGRSQESPPTYGKLAVAIPYGGSKWTGALQKAGVMDREYIAARVLQALDRACRKLFRFSELDSVP